MKEIKGVKEISAIEFSEYRILMINNLNNIIERLFSARAKIRRLKKEIYELKVLGVRKKGFLRRLVDAFMGNNKKHEILND